MSKAALGTMSWAELTQGSLRRRDKLNQILSGIVARLNLVLRATPSPVQVDVDAIVIPDSKMAKEAHELCESSSTPALASHCMRTYLWGALFAQMDGLEYDSEMFFIASLLHDLGLNEEFVFQSDTICCFAYEGAVAAEDFARQRGWSATRTRVLGDAICQHLNVKVPPTCGVEAHLLHEGAGADVLGSRMALIPQDVQTDVITRHPRCGLKEELIETLRPQHQRRPHSRAGLLNSLGFDDLVRKAPFSD